MGQHVYLVNGRFESHWYQRFNQFLCNSNSWQLKSAISLSMKQFYNSDLWKWSWKQPWLIIKHVVKEDHSKICDTFCGCFGYNWKKWPFEFCEGLVHLRFQASNIFARYVRIIRNTPDTCSFGCYFCVTWDSIVTLFQHNMILVEFKESGNCKFTIVHIIVLI